MIIAAVAADWGGGDARYEKPDRLHTPRRIARVWLDRFTVASPGRVGLVMGRPETDPGSARHFHDHGLFAQSGGERVAPPEDAPFCGRFAHLRNVFAPDGDFVCQSVPRLCAADAGFDGALAGVDDPIARMVARGVPAAVDVAGDAAGKHRAGHRDGAGLVYRPDGPFRPAFAVHRRTAGHGADRAFHNLLPIKRPSAHGAAGQTFGAHRQTAGHHAASGGYRPGVGQLYPGPAHRRRPDCRVGLRRLLAHRAAVSAVAGRHCRSDGHHSVFGAVFGGRAGAFGGADGVAQNGAVRGGRQRSGATGGRQRALALDCRPDGGFAPFDHYFCRLSWGQGGGIDGFAAGGAFRRCGQGGGGAHRGLLDSAPAEDFAGDGGPTEWGWV